MAKKELPDNLNPLHCHHPASSAYRVTMSPHEWTWTQEEMEEIARALVVRDHQLQIRGDVTRILQKDLVKTKRDLFEANRMLCEQLKILRILRKGTDKSFAMLEDLQKNFLARCPSLKK